MVWNDSGLNINTTSSGPNSNARNAGAAKEYSRVQNLEISAAIEDEGNETDVFLDDAPINFHTDRHMIFSLIFVVAMAISSFVSLICYVFMIQVLLDLTNRWYICGVTAFLQFMEKNIIFLTLRRVRILEGYSDPRKAFTIPVFMDENDAHPRMRCSVWRGLRFFLELFFIGFISLCYIHYVPQLCDKFVAQFFLNSDGIPASDWEHDENLFGWVAFFSQSCGFLYLASAVFGLLALYHARDDAAVSSVAVHSYGQFNLINAGRVFNVIRCFSVLACAATGLILLLGLGSAWIYLVDHDLPESNKVGRYCDPLDTTECLLPFPSSFFSVLDETTETGIRVNIEHNALSTLYRGSMGSKHLLEVNDRDGFSTSGTIIFYKDGIKEANGIGFLNNTRLIGPGELQLSTSSQSITLLLDMDAKELVPHFAEIDYLDEERPVVIIQSSKTLERNRRYVVALVDAADVDGNKLPVSDYLRILLDNESDAHRKLLESEQRRGLYYRNEVIPTFSDTAPWITSRKIQMLFDFHTASVNGQLGNTHKIMSGMLNLIAGDEWGGWGDHNVRVIEMTDSVDTCSNENNDVGRIVHIEVDLPNFLKGDRRAKLLNEDAIRLGETQSTAPFEVVVIVPCSVATRSLSLRATVDYGHGFLGSRQEIFSADYLLRAANQNGYILFASNWGGMSFLDFPVVVRTFIANPNEVTSIVGNVMQGYANKAAVQDFANNALLNMEFMMFNDSPVHVDEEELVRHVFYGVSLGGIFGSAYTSLLSRTKPNLLDGSILTSAGNPFSLLMSRSALFPSYNLLLEKNLHHNRHTRIFISLLQMHYDAIDGPTVGLSLGDSSSPNSFKTLLQFGLGDNVVSTLASEIMSRDYNASTFPSNPHHIVGIAPMNANSSVCVTEMMYTQPISQLPKTNTIHSLGTSEVHSYTRFAKPLVLQLIEFINTGKFLDVCDTGICVLENPCRSC